MNILQPLLSSSLKDNTSLKLGVLTGVLKVGGESLFSAFNNLKVYDVMSKDYDEYFGFTENETKDLLEYYGLELNSKVSNYYNGYIMGNTRIYNPWSILNYSSEKELKEYWMNTSSNKLIKNLLKGLINSNLIEDLLRV